jgi:hypothetical protein
VHGYRDQFDFGFTAGANVIPRVQEVCGMLVKAFAALEVACAPPREDLKRAAP